jgi:hypothetical protein
MPKPVTRPAFTVVVGRNGQEIRCDANHIGYGMLDGKYVVSWISSGQLNSALAGDVKQIEFHADGTSYCGQCDQPLATWPSNDPSYGSEGPCTA